MGKGADNTMDGATNMVRSKKEETTREKQA